jgi:hypothetical protein
MVINKLNVIMPSFVICYIKKLHTRCGLRDRVPDVKTGEAVASKHHLIVMVNATFWVILLHEHLAVFVGPVEDTTVLRHTAHHHKVRTVGVGTYIEQVRAVHIYGHHRVGTIVREKYAIVDAVNGQSVQRTHADKKCRPRISQGPTVHGQVHAVDSTLLPFLHPEQVPTHTPLNIAHSSHIYFQEAKIQ